MPFTLTALKYSRLTPSAGGGVRNVLLLLLGVTACKAASAVPAAVKTTDEVTVTADERGRMEDSVHVWIGNTFLDWEQADSARLMDTYLPGAEAVVSAGGGELITSRDSVAQFLAGLGQTTGRRASFETPSSMSWRLEWPRPRIASSLRVTTPKKQKVTHRGVYSAVLVEREGHLHIVQEHQSLVP